MQRQFSIVIYWETFITNVDQIELAIFSDNYRLVRKDVKEHERLSNFALDTNIYVKEHERLSNFALRH